MIATKKGSLGFPETGIGIYPGLGGTQRLSRRIGNELAKWLIYSGQVLSAGKAQSLGLIQEVTDVAQIHDIVEKHAAKEKPVRGMIEVPEEFKSLSQLFATTTIDEILAGQIEPDNKAIKKIMTKAPLALKVSEKLLNEGLEPCASKASGLSSSETLHSLSQKPFYLRGQI